ncbi:MAG: enolase C-terminal domain-like protein [Actinophytocola sp.]|uniref:enolase C-terminal domain-like protein n=1 Tax=Actinophytocola sp. TaxID=1872138 RepID=UPI003D6AC2EA
MRFAFSVDEQTLAQPFRVSHTTIRTASVVRLLVRDGDHSGLGEVTAGPGLAHEDPEEVVAQARRLAGRLAESGGPASPQDLAVELAVARADGCPPVALMLVEMSCLDLLAMRARRPLWELLALPPPTPIRLWRTVSLGDPVPDGGSRLKVKLGGPRDAEFLRRLRSLDPGTEVIVDVNRGWDRASWQTVREPLRAARPTAVEDPVADPELLREVRAALPDTPVLLDEEVADLDAVERAARDADGANIKVARLGGLMESRRALEFLRATGKRAMLGCFIEPPRAIAFAAQLAGLADWTDLDGHLVLGSDDRGGTLRLNTQAPGIPRLLD